MRLGAITTTGASNQNGGAVLVTGSGPVSVGGTITTSGGTYLAGNPGRNAGSVTLTGSTVSVAAITAVGTSATSGGNPGGQGGAVLLDATAGGITLGGSLTTTGGNGNVAGSGGSAGSVTIGDATTLNASVVVSSVGGTGGTTGTGGPIQLLGTVDGNVAATRTLTLTGGTGDVTVSGARGRHQFTVGPDHHGQRHPPRQSWCGAAAGVSGATAVTAATAGADIGSITFAGTVYNANAQTYTAPVGNTLLMTAGRRPVSPARPTQ